MVEPIQPTPETEAADAKGTAAPVKKKRRGLLLVLPFLLLPAAGGAWMAFTQYERLDQVAEAAGLTASSEEEKPVKYGQFTEIGNMIINPAGSDGRRYLMVSIGLETDESAVLDELGEKDVVVRDVILKRLGARTVKELSDTKLRDELKQELRDTVNTVLSRGAVSRMYFTQYVLQ